jgi:hypothetical protein
MSAIDQHAHAGARKLFFPLDQVADRVALLRMGIHLQEPAEALRFEERGVEGERGRDA